MGRRKVEKSVDEAVELAQTIASMRPSQIVFTIQELMFRRELSSTVSALNSLLLEHPNHRALAAQALAKMGLWQDATKA